MLARQSPAQALHAIQELPPDGGKPYETLLQNLAGAEAVASCGLDGIFIAMKRDTRLPREAWRPHAWLALLRAYHRCTLRPVPGKLSAPPDIVQSEESSYLSSSCMRWRMSVQARGTNVPAGCL